MSEGKVSVYFVYMLRCGDGSVYTGITTDPARRLAQHRSGKGAKYTASHGAQDYEALWQAGDRAAASRLEYRIKKLPKADKESLLRHSVTPALERLTEGFIPVKIQ